jgi:hypothetical protein
MIRYSLQKAKVVGNDELPRFKGGQNGHELFDIALVKISGGLIQEEDLR